MIILEAVNQIIKWGNIPWTFLCLFIFPGLLYIGLAKGFREKRPIFSLLVEALIYSSLFLVGAFFALFFAAIVLKLGTKDDVTNAVVGLLILFSKGIIELLKQGSDISFSTTCIFIFTYTFSAFYGLSTKMVNEGRFPWRKDNRHKLIANSVLDVELLKLRQKKIIPEIIITLENGEIVKGKCHSYTFTEPREIAMNLNDITCSEKHIVWLKLDENILKLEIVYDDGSPEKRKVFDLSVLKKNKKDKL